MKSLLIVLLLGLFGTVGAQPLGGTKWVLSSMDDLETGISKDIGATVKATLQFDSDTTYSGKFCNAYNGHYRHNKIQAIKLGIPGSTKMLCMGIDKYEKEMFAVLPLANKYRIEDEALYIFTSNHKRLHFVKDGSVKK